jgi:hypothetical protein
MPYSINNANPTTGFLAAPLRSPFHCLRTRMVEYRFDVTSRTDENMATGLCPPDRGIVKPAFRPLVDYFFSFALSAGHHCYGLQQVQGYHGGPVSRDSVDCFILNALLYQCSPYHRLSRCSASVLPSFLHCLETRMADFWFQWLHARMVTGLR